jgi:hypothetical protein
MELNLDDWIKHRHLRLFGAGDAERLIGRLREREGVRAVEMHGSLLRIDYDLDALTLAEVIAEGRAAGFEPASSWPARLFRALVNYWEQTQREHRTSPFGWDEQVSAVYMSRFRRHRHGRIDDRPQQWRRYLERERVAAPGKPDDGAPAD